MTQRVEEVKPARPPQSLFVFDGCISPKCVEPLERFILIEWSTLGHAYCNVEIPALDSTVPGHTGSMPRQPTRLW